MNLDLSFIGNTVDPDQLGSDEAIRSGSTLFSILFEKAFLQIDDKIWEECCIHNIISMTRV